MGLANSLFGYTYFKKRLDEVDCFLNEHLPHKFISIFSNKVNTFNKVETGLHSK